MLSSVVKVKRCVMDTSSLLIVVIIAHFVFPILKLRFLYQRLLVETSLLPLPSGRRGREAFYVFTMTHIHYSISYRFYNHVLNTLIGSDTYHTE